jgi:hypothetical protein
VTQRPCIIRRRPIFPGRYQPSIVGTRELNCCVRNGNRCGLSVISTGRMRGRNAPSGLHKGRRYWEGARMISKEWGVDSSYCVRKRRSESEPDNLWSSPRPISTGQLNTLLCLHTRPINQVVCLGSYHYCGKSHLEVGFTLRCFQRLSHPNLAIQPCHWRDNWCTIGLSIPVLSY